MNSNIKGIFVSCDTYGKGINNLKGTNKTILEIYNFFVANISEKNNCILIQDEKQDNVIHKIYKFIGDIGKDDILLFYFCGHGFINNDQFENIILGCSNTEDITKDTIGIKIKDLINKIKNKRSSNIFIIDCCYSGMLNKMGSNLIDLEKAKAQQPFSVVISSSNGSNSSYEIETDNGIRPCFSHYFYESLVSSDEFDIRKIFESVKSKIEKNTAVNMVPQISVLNEVPVFEIHKPQIDKECVLDIVDWRITSNCNNNCKICYACKECNEIERGAIDKIINELKSSGCKSVCVTGGEATLSKHFEYIIGKLYENEFLVYLSTNGSNYSSYKSFYNEKISKLSLPLDGYNEESNMLNGRSRQSFKIVKSILNDCKKNQKNFKIKISTVLTKKTCDSKHIEKMYGFLSKYKIDKWKIYEFIPENEGAKNKDEYFLENKIAINKIAFLIEKLNKNSEFQIELVRRTSRNAAYFIIQPNGDVIIPCENDKDKIVDEIVLGNLIDGNILKIFENWKKNVDYSNYLRNSKSRNLFKSYYLSYLDRLILYCIIYNINITSTRKLSEVLKIDESLITKSIDNLYKKQIIKSVIPMLNLKALKLNTYLVVLNFQKKSLFPNDYIIDYLKNNQNIGWIIECENRIIRLAIFAKSEDEVSEIILSMNEDLNGEIVNSWIYTNDFELAIGEGYLFNKDDFTSNGKLTQFFQSVSSESSSHESLIISLNEYNVLKELELTGFPTFENINNRIILDNEVSSETIINELINRGIIERIYTILDTRLLGYKWYIIPIKTQSSDTDAVTDFLKNNYDSITHINNYKRINNNDYSMDFEVHISSYAEIENIIESLINAFKDIMVDEPLRIIKEHKFTFTTKYVMNEIYSNFWSEN